MLIEMPVWPTRITQIDVQPCYDLKGHDDVTAAALEEFTRVTNEAAQLLSWYLREAGGIPSNHSFLRVIVRDSPDEVASRRDVSPASWGFESMDALVDWSLLYLNGREQEKAALAWLRSVVRYQSVEWGLRTDCLDSAFDAAVAREPAMIAPDRREVVSSIGDDPSMSEDEFWGLIDLLQGKADDDGCRRLRSSLSSRPSNEILGFARLLEAALAVLDTPDHKDPRVLSTYVKGPLGSELPFSDDTFLYVRCDVVASGRASWLRVANDPEAMADPWDITSERLLAVVPSLLD